MVDTSIAKIAVSNSVVSALRDEVQASQWPIEHKSKQSQTFDALKCR